MIAYIFKRFLYKPLLATLKKRENTIRKGLSDAESASKALADAESKSNEMLSKAGIEAERLLTESKKQAQITREEMIEDTKKDLDKMMEKTKEQIGLERENFKKEATDMSLEISKKILGETIKGLFDKKEQEELIKKGINKIAS